jgi:DHA2 family multidrug resistance protein-like MFS transporter
METRSNHVLVGTVTLLLVLATLLAPVIGPSLALLSAIVAPLLARRVRPGHVVAAVLVLSAGGYALLGTGGAAGGTATAVAGFSLVYLGLGAIAALGTDLVVGAAPREKAGSAAAMSETVQ